MNTIQKIVSRLDNEFDPVVSSDKTKKRSLDRDDASTALSTDIVLDLDGVDVSELKAEQPSVVESRSEVFLLPDKDSPRGNDEVRYSSGESADSVIGARSGYCIELPFEQLKSNGMVTPDAPKSRIAEEFRSIKRPLLSNIANLAADKRHSNIIMVTSCVEGEGKTFSAMNLSMSMAMERGRSVLLIDADIAKATASGNLGLTDEQPGLTELLFDPSMDVRDVIYRTNLENFSFMPAGSKSDYATELLSSDGMNRRLEQLSLSDPDRIIIFDAPPVLMTSEAIALAERVGQIVFVVGAESITQGMVLDALGRIGGKAWTGLLLNKTRKKISSSYGYGYGYGQDRTRPVSGARSGAS